MEATSLTNPMPLLTTEFDSSNWKQRERKKKVIFVSACFVCTTAVSNLQVFENFSGKAYFCIYNKIQVSNSFHDRLDDLACNSDLLIP